MVNPGGRSPSIFALLTVIAAALAAIVPRANAQEPAGRDEGGAELSLRLTSYTALSHGGADFGDADSWSLYSGGFARLSFATPASRRAAKAELELRAYAGDTSYIDVSKAAIKLRVQGFRLTAGKTRLAWGEGMFFNAASLLGDSTTIAADIRSDELRDANALLAAVYLPTGTFSFVEAVALPKPLPLASLLTGAGAVAGLPGLDETMLGARVRTMLGETALEFGYRRDAKSGRHLPSAALQGRLLADLYIAAASSLSDGDLDLRPLGDNLDLSGGFFERVSTKGAGTWNFRLEALVRPSATWSGAQAGAAAESYGLYLYAEILWQESEALALRSRAVVSPIDESVLLALSLRLKAAQDCSIVVDVSANAGPSGAVFAHDKSPNASLVLALEMAF